MTDPTTPGSSDGASAEGRYNGSRGSRIRVLAETAYPISAPGSRVRLASFAPFLTEHGVDLDYRPQLSDAEYELLTSPARVGRKALAVASSSRRLITPEWQDYDLRMVYRVRALFPLPGLEPLSWVDVYDFDDALFMGSISQANIRYAWLKRESERWLRYIVGARLVIAGNSFLADRAREHARRVEIVPSCVDPNRFKVREHAETDCVAVGWIGSRSTSDYLYDVLPAFERINRDRTRMKLILVGATLDVERPWIEQRPWSTATETDDLATFDIGIMPLPDDDWARGKCGYKLLQYFAAGVPAVSSPVGVNRKLIAGERGLLAETTQEWVDALETLAGDVETRRDLGEAARAYASEKFSYQRWAPDFAELLGTVSPNAASAFRPAPRRARAERRRRVTAVPRVLHLLPCDDWGGTEVQISTQVLLTNPDHCEQTVAILQSPGVVFERLRAGGVEVHSLRSRLGMPGSLRRLVRVLRNDDFDAIEAYGFKAGLLARLAARIAGGPPVVIGVRGLHFTAAGEAGVGRNTRVVLSVERALSWMVGRYDANSQGARNFLVANGFSSEKFRVIVNGVETHNVPTSRHEPGHRPRVVCVARFVPLKRHDLLLRSLAAVREAGIDFDCQLIGYGPTLDQCRELAAGLGLADRIEFPGRLPQAEIRSRLAEAEVFALVSTWEGMPGSVLEAMAAGIPAVGTNVNGTNEVIVHGHTGFLVPPDNEEALQEALSTLLTDPELRSQMGAEGRRRVEQHFSFERVVAEKVAFYAEVAGKPVPEGVMVPSGNGGAMVGNGAAPALDRSAARR